MKIDELHDIFEQLVRRGKLSHAYLLFGAPSLSLGLGLARFLEQGSWEQGVRPLSDALVLTGGEIGVNDARSMIHFLYQRPTTSQYRIGVVDMARGMNTIAQNALLKVTEEPPASGVLLFLARDPELLIAPLCSRVQKFYISDPTLLTSVFTNDDVLAFQKASTSAQKELLKEIVQDNDRLHAFVRGVFSTLCRDTMKNRGKIQELLKRWSLMQQYNVNKRLQLEAVLL